MIEAEFYPDMSFLITVNVNGAARNCVRCGIHIHEGNCVNPGDHYFDKNKLPLDPWKGASFSADGNVVVTEHSFWILDGYNFDENHGKVVNLHDESGAMIA